MKEQTNEGVYIGCRKILYDSPMNEKKIAVNFLIYLCEICKLSL